MQCICMLRRPGVELKGELVMRKRTLLLMALMMVAAAIAPVAANDVYQGPPEGWWMRGEPGSTWAHWDFQTLDPVSFPFEGLFPFSLPVADFPTGTWEWFEEWECPIEMDPDGFVDGWHCTSPEGGTIVLHIPNYPDPNQVKMIFIQITSTKFPSDVSVVGMGPEPSGYASDTWPTGLPHIQWPGPAPFGGAWYTYNLGRYIMPNPEAEDILITVPYCTVIDQIVVDTICTDTVIGVEPSSWSEVKALFQ